MDIDIVILFLIVFVIGILFGANLKKNSTTSEHIVNLDDSRKVELSKCCTDSKCYSKPPHLRNNCDANKADAKQELDKEFKQMYTQEEYYKKLEDLGITQKGQLANIDIDKAYIAKMNEQIVINPAMDTSLDATIRNDDRDEVRGYDVDSLAPYTK
jgi:predicted membrane protein